jgi:hypothetical protein
MEIMIWTLGTIAVLYFVARFSLAWFFRKKKYRG